MCGHCHGGEDCYGWNYHPRYYGPRRRYYYDEESGPEDRREYLVEEKKALENRLKEIESRLGEASK
jgi:hypothetical protein